MLSTDLERLVQDIDKSLKYASQQAAKTPNPPAQRWTAATQQPHQNPFVLPESTHVPPPPNPFLLPAENTPQTDTIFTSVGMKLALMPAGWFRRFSPKLRDWDAISPSSHLVHLTRPFYLGIYPVTNGEDYRLTGQDLRRRENPTHPTSNITWHRAIDFCNRFSIEEGRSQYYDVKKGNVTIAGGGGYRLPTEAEWEYGLRCKQPNTPR